MESFGLQRYLAGLVVSEGARKAFLGGTLPIRHGLQTGHTVLEGIHLTEHDAHRLRMARAKAGGNFQQLGKWLTPRNQR